MLFADHCPQFKVSHYPFLAPKKDDFLFCYKDNEIGLLSENRVPLISDLIQDLSKVKLFCFGSIDNHNCFLWNDNVAESKLNFAVVKWICSSLSQKFQQAVVLGNYIDHWRKINSYCGKCGSAMQDGLKERARVCPNCKHTIYPRISPCVMVLITHGEKILLARSPHFRPGMFSVLAGFVDIGETVEQAIVREVKEEVGIEVNNFEYVCSQPWLFPDSLLLGFTAKYVAGEIAIDKTEIECADWFDKNNLPELPYQMSLSRYLIERYLGVI